MLLLAVALVGCGGSDSPSDEASSSESTSPQSASAEEVDRTITLHPKGNQMQYRETEFTVAPGETIELVFENTATSPSMSHNVVVLNSTEDAVFERVGEAGMSAGSTNDYVPEDDAILAYTEIAPPGETVSVTFTVPEEPGEYGYVCTFPGHWATMQGTMYVE
jgi:azurin